MTVGTEPHTDSRPAPLRLKVTAGNAQGTEIQVDDEFVIGRLADCVGRLAADVEISRRHARIALVDGDYVIEDLGSTNGTFVNGARLSGPEILSVGDKVEVGGTTLVVQVSTKPSASQGPPRAGVPEVEAGPEAGPAGGVRPLSLRLEYGPEPGTARVLLGEESEPIELVHGEGGWRLRRD
jgi:pSer/pThr/pTyr-binding forkhead associated (FHA) protein